MSRDAAGLKAEVTFFYLAKFDGEITPKPDGITQYDALCQDLADPKCVELIVGGEALPTQIWRKQCP